MKNKKAKKSSASNESALQKFVKLPSTKKRRLVLKSVVFLGILGVGAGAISGYDAKKKELHDLSVIGNGQAVVVQIHDTSCSICRSLKSRTAKVLDDNPHIAYRLADIVSAKGREFQEKYGVQKTTLLLFNAEGKHINTVVGLQTIEELERLFARSLPPPA